MERAFTRALLFSLTRSPELRFLLRFSSPDLCCLALVTGVFPRRQVTGQPAVEDEKDWWFALGAEATESRRRGCIAIWTPGWRHGISDLGSRDSRTGLRTPVVESAPSCRRSAFGCLPPLPTLIALRWEPRFSEWSPAGGAWRSLDSDGKYRVSAPVFLGEVAGTLGKLGSFVGGACSVLSELEEDAQSPVALVTRVLADVFTRAPANVKRLDGGTWFGNLVWKVGWVAGLVVVKTTLLTSNGSSLGSRYGSGQPAGSFRNPLLVFSFISPAGKDKLTGILWSFPKMTKIFLFLVSAISFPEACVDLSLEQLFRSGFCGIVSPNSLPNHSQLEEIYISGPSPRCIFFGEIQELKPAWRWTRPHQGRWFLGEVWLGVENLEEKMCRFSWDPGEDYPLIGIGSLRRCCVAVLTAKPDLLGFRFPATLVTRTTPTMELEACLRMELSQTNRKYVYALSDLRLSCGGCFFWQPSGLSFRWMLLESNGCPDFRIDVWTIISVPLAVIRTVIDGTKACLWIELSDEGMVVPIA